MSDDIFSPGHPAPAEGMDLFQEMYYSPLLYDHGASVKKATPGGGKSHAAHMFMTMRILHAIRADEEGEQEKAFREAESKPSAGSGDELPFKMYPQLF